MTPRHPCILVLCAVMAFLASLMIGAMSATAEDSSEISSRVSRKQEELAASGQELNRLNQGITEQEILLDQTRNELAQARTQLMEAEARHDESVRLFGKRLAEIYKLGGSNFYAFIPVILSSEDFSDAVTRVSYLLKISENDARLIEKVRAEAREVGALRDRIDELEQSQAQELDSMLEQSAGLAEQITADQQEVESEMAKLKQARAREEEEARKAAEMAKPQDGGLFGGGIGPSPLADSGPPDGLQPTGIVLDGIASWYGPRFHGQRTATGEVYNMYALTAAHRTLPLGTWLKVTYNGSSVFVRINDRGPYIAGRFLDLSLGSAQAIGLTGIGYATAEIYR